MRSEIHLGVMRAQKHNIQISRVTYLLIKSFKFIVKSILLEVFIWSWKYFLQLFSKLNRKHLI
jgi:hypothetical protein